MPFNEDTRVKIPATIQFMRIGYDYQSLKDVDLHTETRIAVNRFAPAIRRINSREYSDAEIQSLIDDIHSIIKNNDMGQAFYNWLIDPQERAKLIDFENTDNNDFAVIDELSFGKEGTESDREGSFRPDITVFINGIPLAFLEVKPPNNDGGIQVEFERMLNKRLDKPEYKKFFNMLQIVSFSNNMEYEDVDDAAPAEEVKAGSFYTTPNGQKTTFSFFREEHPKTDGFLTITADTVKYVLKDNHYSPTEADTPEFQTNLEPDQPCNRFITSLFSKERVMYYLQYGITYVEDTVKQKFIMRYPQFFASQAIVKRLESGGKAGIIFHTQGSGKTGLAGFSVRILRDYYAKKGITARFYYVVDRLDLLTQVSTEMRNRGLLTVNVESRDSFQKELDRPLSKHMGHDTNGEITVVNIHKFSDKMPVAKNDYGANIQRIFFIDEAHRSYAMHGEFFKNLMLVDVDAVYLAMTGTPLLSKKERSNLKFGDYIHKYFYDKSIADGYTLRIKEEQIDTTARTEIRKNLEIEDGKPLKDSVLESENYINALCRFVEKDFKYFRLTNNDATIGGMIVSSSNLQARRIKEWFDHKSNLTAGLVISADDIPSAANKATQLAFKNTLQPDILVVHLMLTTGYDVNRLKKMYLLRNAKEHNLLQTISRVNRPYRSPSGRNYQYGYIVDFVDIEAEYDRTIEMYLKEINEEFNEDEESGNVNGLVIGPDDINKKYQKLKADLDGMVDTSNLERFSKMLTFMNKDGLLTIRRILNGIKDCHTEFLLSRATAFAEQIDIDHIKKLLRLTQDRIDFINLKTTPTSLLAIIDNREVVNIIYEFFKTKITILDLGKFQEVLDKFSNSPGYSKLTDQVEAIQKEIKKNRNHNQIQMIKLDELLQKIFAMLEIADIENLAEVNEELAKVLAELRRINEENERLAARYDGDYAFVKTYTDAVEIHPDLDKEDIASVMDVVYAAVKDVRDTNILTIQQRDNFVGIVKKNTTATLLKSGLYKKLKLKDWYTDLLNETYANMKIF